MLMAKLLFINTINFIESQDTMTTSWLQSLIGKIWNKNYVSVSVEILITSEVQAAEK